MMLMAWVWGLGETHGGGILRGTIGDRHPSSYYKTIHHIATGT